MESPYANRREFVNAAERVSANYAKTPEEAKELAALIAEARRCFDAAEQSGSTEDADKATEALSRLRRFMGFMG